MAHVPPIRVTGVRQASSLLTAGEPFEYVISIGDPGEEVPDGLRTHPAKKVRFEFQDACLGAMENTPEAFPHAPTLMDVRGIIEFSRLIDGPTLIHCHAGLSRAPGVAFVVLAAMCGPGKGDKQLVEEYRKATPCGPLDLLVQLADFALNRNGTLFSVYERYLTRK